MSCTLGSGFSEDCPFGSSNSVYKHFYIKRQKIYDPHDIHVSWLSLGGLVVCCMQKHQRRNLSFLTGMLYAVFSLDVCWQDTAGTLWDEVISLKRTLLGMYCTLQTQIYVQQTILDSWIDLWCAGYSLLWFRHVSWVDYWSLIWDWDYQQSVTKTGRQVITCLIGV